MEGAYRLLAACAAGDVVLVERAWGAWPEGERNVDVRGETGRTPLHLAASCGSTAVVEWLLERGAGRDLRDAIGWTALHHAANSGTPAAPRPPIPHTHSFTAHLSLPSPVRTPQTYLSACNLRGTWLLQAAWRR